MPEQISDFEAGRRKGWEEVIGELDAQVNAHRRAHRHWIAGNWQRSADLLRDRMPKQMGEKGGEE